MKLAYIAMVAQVLVAAPVYAQPIYRCDVDGRIVFSQTSCGADAVVLKRSRKDRKTPTAPPAGTFEASSAVTQFEALGVAPAADLLDRFGQPAAHYAYRGVDFWLYPDTVRRGAGKPRSPVILLENGYSFQVSWLSAEMMQKTVAVARELEGWKPRGSVDDKDFTINGVSIHGETKSAILHELGEPDAKNVCAGRECWEYERVRIAPDRPARLTLVVEFAGGVVSGAGRL